MTATTPTRNFVFVTQAIAYCPQRGIGSTFQSQKSHGRSRLILASPVAPQQNPSPSPAPSAPAPPRTAQVPPRHYNRHRQPRPNTPHLKVPHRSGGYRGPSPHPHPLALPSGPRASYTDTTTPADPHPAGIVAVGHLEDRTMTTATSGATQRYDDITDVPGVRAGHYTNAADLT